jgi:Predicted nucleotidyltransferases
MAKIPSDIINIINRYIDIIKKDIKINRVILYGSYAKGTYSEESDIDIAIIIDGYDETNFINMGTFLLDKSFVLKVDIQPLPFSINEYSAPKGIMEEIINTGVELYVA